MPGSSCWGGLNAGSKPLGVRRGPCCAIRQSGGCAIASQRNRLHFAAPSPVRGPAVPTLPDRSAGPWPPPRSRASMHASAPSGRHLPSGRCFLRIAEHAGGRPMHCSRRAPLQGSSPRQCRAWSMTCFGSYRHRLRFAIQSNWGALGNQVKLYGHIQYGLRAPALLGNNVYRSVR